MTAVMMASAAALAVNAASTGTYIKDISEIPTSYLKTYYADFINRADLSNGGIDCVEFCYAKDQNHIKSGQNHNSLCFIVAADDMSNYSLYEYADIKKDSNGKLLPATYKGKTKSFNSEDKMWKYLDNTYQYCPFGNGTIYEIANSISWKM